MVPMVIEFKKHLKIYWKLIRFSASLETEYRFSFLMEILVEIAYFAVTLLGMRVIFWNVKEVAGWSFYQLLTLYGVNMVFSELVLGLAFIFNLRRLPEKVIYGDLDIILTKPINSQFAVSLWRPYFALIPGLLAGVAIVYYGFTAGNLGFSFINTLPFIWLFICGLIAAYSIGMIITTLSVWLINAVSLPTLAEQIIFLAKQPRSIFDRGWRVLFMTVLPTVFMVSVPTETLMGKLQIYWLIAAPALALSLLILSNLIWEQSLKSYCSASS